MSKQLRLNVKLGSNLKLGGKVEIPKYVKRAKKLCFVPSLQGFSAKYKIIKSIKRNLKNVTEMSHLVLEMNLIA